MDTARRGARGAEQADGAPLVPPYRLRATRLNIALFITSSPPAAAAPLLWAFEKLGAGSLASTAGPRKLRTCPCTSQ